jgi:rhamnogalacturonyl hydrolase YesR
VPVSGCLRAQAVGSGLKNPVIAKASIKTGYVTRGAELGKNDGISLAVERRYQEICRDVLQAAKRQDFAGFSKFDALNSPLLQALSLNNKWLRLIYTQIVNRCSFHVRPLFRVKKSRNPKGIALFARAYLFLYSATGDGLYRNEAERLLQWLTENKAKGSRYPSWGYNFIWQNTIFLQGMNEPNCVVSVFAGEAFVHAYRLLKDVKYLLVARDIANFVIKGLPVLFESRNEIAIGYVQGKSDSLVLNINALAGAFLAKVWKETKEQELLDLAKKLLEFTVNRRTPYNAWYYTHPKESSPIKHDNYHTGGILDALLEYFEETADDQYMDVYWKGLDYYQKYLFEPGGAPRWMNDRKYPFDIHGAAQGIISFSKAARQKKEFLFQAERIVDWTIGNLYRKETCDFAYRKGRYMTWNYSLMRWCNAWMARALGEILSIG